MGRLADYAWPEPIGKAVVNLYCRAYDVEMAVREYTIDGVRAARRSHERTNPHSRESRRTSQGLRARIPGFSYYPR